VRLRVAIDGLSARMGGGAVYLKNQLRAIANQAPDWQFVVFCVPQNFFHVSIEADNVEIVVVRRAGRSLMDRILWQQFILPSELRARGIDLLYCPGNFCLAWSPCPQVLTLQNPNHFASLSYQHTLGRKIAYLFRRIGSVLSIRRADFTIFISHDYRHMVERVMSLDGVKWDVVYSGIDEIFLNESSAKHETTLRVPANYILAVSNFYPHKNYETLFVAFELLSKRRMDGLHLLVAGAPLNRTYHEEMKRIISRLKAVDRIRLLGPVPQTDLSPLYSRARCYVSTSVLEAFPLTPFEAMACGVPVIVSHATVFPEICEDAAVYCDPLDPEDVASKIELVLDNESLATDLVRKGIQQAKKFSWGKNAQRLLEIFEYVARLGKRVEICG
jgi:glycosyltransferase involved in cell wall biosynthesis